MTYWVDKIYLIPRNIIVSILQSLKRRRRIIKTKALRNERKTDIDRWENPKELDTSWNERTNIMARMVESGARVIEFGAGNMALKLHLPPNCSYQPSDIVSRVPEIIECDLNEDFKIELSEYDTAVFSGVLEYVYDIDTVFAYLEPYIENIILSYACRDISNADRFSSGWLSDYSRKELEDIFYKYRYHVLEYKEWRNQSIFCLKKV